MAADFTITHGFAGLQRKNFLSPVARIPMDIWFLAMMIGICNYHIITGQSCEDLIFRFDGVMSGEVYRLLTHPFVHISWYHFLLDAGAFVLLYTGLNEKRKLRKLWVTGACGLSSLVISLITEPAIYAQGLCGLSGISHGLMAFSALEMMQEKTGFRAGFICLSAVVLKSIYEAVTGNVIFSFLQFGLCGDPIAVCHAGGVMGGIISYFILKYADIFKNSRHLNKVLWK